MKRMHNKADVTSWLEKARDDLRFAEAVLGDTFYSHVCFTSQQAAEKSLKALIYSLQEDFLLSEIKKLKTHKLESLVIIIEKHHIVIPDNVKKACSILDRYYMPTRYPDVPDPIGKYTQEIALDAFTQATTIFEFVENELT